MHTTKQFIDSFVGATPFPKDYQYEEGENRFGDQ
jgi:hypothetical protein